ncbi:hypothetical protein BGX28_007243 [Mortierella sp. GBA30]|nr:hypothetical protein BGX28_007243 [Mortierella sp. GBA30]
MLSNRVLESDHDESEYNAVEDDEGDSDERYKSSAEDNSDGFYHEEISVSRRSRSRSGLKTADGSSRSSSVQKAPVRSKLYVCQYPECGKSYSRPSRLLEHERAHTGESHGTLRQFKCTQPNCTKAFYSQDKLTRHLKSHDEIASMPVTPQNGFTDEGDSEKPSSMDPEIIRRIAEDIKKEKPYACAWDGCFKRFTKHQKLKAHVCMIHEGRKPYPCTHEGCTMSFQTPSKLRKHHLVHNDANRYGCGYSGCDSFFSKWSMLQKHNKTYHKSAPCPVCGKTVLNKTLKAHLKIHDTSRPQVSCTYDGCIKVFSTERTLAVHVKTVHKRLKDAPVFKCDYEGCGRTFDYKHVLERHKNRIHEEPKPRKKRQDAIEATFMDSIVGFTKEDAEAKLPFACTVPDCNARYSSERLLNRHLNSRKHEQGEITGMDAIQSMVEAENQSIRDMIDLHIGNDTRDSGK